MKWQDVALAAGNALFAIALVPSVVAGDPPAALTAGLTAAVISYFPPVMLTLQLRLSAAVTTVNAALWWVLFVEAI